MAIRPNLWSSGMVEPDGRLSRTFIDYLDGIVSTATTEAGASASIAALTARVMVLEAENIDLQGFNGVTVYGSAEAGYQIHGDGFGPIAAQVFGS